MEGPVELLAIAGPGEAALERAVAWLAYSTPTRQRLLAAILAALAEEDDA